MKTLDLYEKDFFAWTQEQAKLIKEKAFNKLDYRHLQEELQIMGASEKRELESRLEILLMHLLKWKYQPIKRTMSWELTIKEQRKKLHTHLRDNPSLQTQETFNQRFLDAYETAILKAAKETELSPNAFPERCEWKTEQILNEEFYPI